MERWSEGESQVKTEPNKEQEEGDRERKIERKRRRVTRKTKNITFQLKSHFSPYLRFEFNRFEREKLQKWKEEKKREIETSVSGNISGRRSTFSIYHLEKKHTLFRTFTSEMRPLANSSNFSFCGAVYRHLFVLTWSAEKFLSESFLYEKSGKKISPKILAFKFLVRQGERKKKLNDVRHSRCRA